VTCEVVANNALLDPMVEGLVVTFRTFDEGLLLGQMLESVGLGAPVTETLELAVQVIGEETLAAKGAIAYHPSPNGFESCLATPGLPEIMRGGPQRGAGRGRGILAVGPSAPYAPGAARDLAGAAGGPGCAVPRGGRRRVLGAPEINDGRAVACMIAWRTKDEPPEPAHRLTADRLVRHIGVALERDHHTMQLQDAALHDSLTSLPNRLQFFDRLDREMTRAKHEGSTLAVFYVDLDGFKRVNDLLGHPAGDEVLVEAARRIENAVRPGDLGARLGGDEFAVICPDIAEAYVAHQIAERLVHEVAKPISLSSDGAPCTSVPASASRSRSRPTTPPRSSRQPTPPSTRPRTLARAAGSAPPVEREARRRRGPTERE